MLFFKSLENIGIDRNQLQNISDEDIIRIEKKLIADRNLNNSLSKDDIEKILFILKHYRAEIRAITFYEHLYCFLRGIPANYEDSLRFHTKEEVLRIRELISIHFKAELIGYIVRDFRENNFDNLRKLLKYPDFLNKELEEFIILKMEDKLEEGFTVLEQMPPRNVLTKKVGFLRKEAFYILMYEIHPSHFTPYVYRFLKFIVDHEKYTARTPFFDDLLTYLTRYGYGNSRVINDISVVMRSHGGQDRFIYFSVLFMFVVVCLFAFWISNREKNSISPTDQQHLDMMAFVEARVFPVQQSKATDRLPFIETEKYSNPFNSALFKGNSSAIKQMGETGAQLRIFNKTQNECIVLAYYDDHYLPKKMDYVKRVGYELPEIYALYIPEYESIEVDFHMSVLRLYMGKKLKEFNTYHDDVYPDSMDRKFSEFNKIDSTLFRYGLRFMKELGEVRRTQKLVISQPDPKHYQLDWIGNSTVVYGVGNLYDMNNLDTLRKGRPLILPERDVPATPKVAREKDSDIYSFLRGF